MFADIDADIYVIVDGDATYDAFSAPLMINELITTNSDMVVGVRQEVHKKCYRTGHRFGNSLLTFLANFFLDGQLTDILSGYRVFSKRFVKNFPANSRGFEIETELTLFALSRRLPIREISTPYFPRSGESKSKLSTYRDGIKILRTIIYLVKEERPMLFFTIISAVLFLLSVGISVPLIFDYIQTGLVPRLPTAVLATGIMVCSVICGLIGLLLDSVASVKKELFRQNYLKF